MGLSSAELLHGDHGLAGVNVQDSVRNNEAKW
jgi:hypothetical protein